MAVPEFQKRGAVHYHLVIFNLKYIKASKIEYIWGNGFVKIKSIEEVDNIGAYMSKYMTKDADKENRLVGSKCYFRSRNLYEPIEKTVLSSSPEGQELIKTIDTMELLETYSNEQMSEHYGVSASMLGACILGQWMDTRQEENKRLLVATAGNYGPGVPE